MVYRSLPPLMNPRFIQGEEGFEEPINPFGVEFSEGSLDTGFDNLGLAPQMDQQARLSIAGLDPSMSMGEIGNMGISPLSQEQINADMAQLQSGMATSRTERDRIMEQVGMNYTGPSPGLQGAQTTGPYVAGLGPNFALSREGQQRTNVMKAHSDFIKAHPPGSEDFNTYRQRLIDSGIFESDHILANQQSYTPGAPGPMTLPDALRKMYNVPKGQEISRDDVRGRAKGAAIAARRQEKSQAHKEVMANFGGDYSQYDKWWNSLPGEARPKSWGEARDALRLGFAGQGGYQGETTGPGMLANDYQFQGGGSGVDIGVPPGIARMPDQMQSIDPGREALMNLSQGEMPEQFASSMPGQAMASMPEDQGPYSFGLPDAQQVSDQEQYYRESMFGEAGAPIQSMPFSDYVPLEDRMAAGQQMSQLPGDDVYGDAGLYGSQKAEMQRIQEQARYGDPFAGAPDIQQFMAQSKQPTMRQATESEARTAKRGGSLADSFNEWNSVKDQLAQATMFEMNIPQEVKDIESRVKRDVSRARRTLRQAPKRVERLMAFGTANNINLQPVLQSILTQHYADVPGKNYQRQMGATQTQDAAGLFEDRGAPGARSQLDTQLMRVTASLPKAQRAQFTRQTEWLRSFAAEMVSLGVGQSGPMRGPAADFGRFLDESSSVLREVDEQVRGSRARRGRRRLRRQLKER